MTETTHDVLACEVAHYDHTPHKAENVTVTLYCGNLKKLSQVVGDVTSGIRWEPMRRSKDGNSIMTLRKSDKGFRFCREQKLVDGTFSTLAIPRHSFIEMEDIPFCGRSTTQMTIKRDDVSGDWLLIIARPTAESLGKVRKAPGRGLGKFVQPKGMVIDQTGNGHDLPVASVVAENAHGRTHVPMTLLRKLATPMHAHSEISQHVGAAQAPDWFRNGEPNPEGPRVSPALANRGPAAPAPGEATVPVLVNGVLCDVPLAAAFDLVARFARR